MTMWNKLYSKITASSVWEEEPETRLVWITLLAMCDRDGIAHVNPKSLYRIANVSQDGAEEALGVLSAPDPHSTSKEFEGRRIRIVPGKGILVINHTKYHEPSPGAVRQAKYRQRVKTANGPDSDTVSHNGVTTRPDQTIQDQESPPVVPQGTKKRKRVKQKRQVPEDLIPGESVLKVANELRVVLAEELPKFMDHHAARGTTMLDWQAALRTWVRNAAKFQEQANARAQQGQGGSFRGRGTPGLVLEPNGRARAYAAEHALDLNSILSAMTEQGAVDALGLKGAQEELKKRLQAARKAK